MHARSCVVGRWSRGFPRPDWHILHVWQGAFCSLGQQWWFCWGQIYCLWSTVQPPVWLVHVWLHCCYTLGPILLARVSNVLIFCLIWLVWPDYVYHQFAWCPYRTFPLSRYLAALDPLMHPGSPSYLGLHSHGHTTPLACLPLHQFWHVWVILTAITKISFAAYSVPYQASVSPCLACWCIASASCDLIFLWLSPSCIVYSVCTRPESLQTWSSCNPRTINHLLELRSPALPKSSFTSLSLRLRLSLKSAIWSNYSI